MGVAVLHDQGVANSYWYLKLNITCMKSLLHSLFLVFMRYHFKHSSGPDTNIVT